MDETPRGPGGNEEQEPLTEEETMADSAQWLYSLGKNAFNRKDHEGARESFEKLIEIAPGFADVWNMLGQIHHHEGDPEQAAECFEKALEINPRYADAQYNLAVTYSEIGEYEKAQRIYDQARKTERGQGDSRIPDANVRAKLANMHAEIADIYHGLGLHDDAVEQYRKALSLRPEFPDIRLRLGQALFDGGKKPAAIAELQEVKLNRPDFLKARAVLGMFLFSTGKIEEARKEWRDILADNPDFERAKVYLELANKNK